MPIPSDTLAFLAAGYTRDMSSIRGRRVQRLLQREFAGADELRIVQPDGGAPGVLGLSASGAAFCATDGRGRHASVLKWRHGSATAQDTQFDLLKDSLPVAGTQPVPLPAAIARLASPH